VYIICQGRRNQWSITLAGMFVVLLSQDFKFVTNFKKRIENVAIFNVPFRVLRDTWYKNSLSTNQLSALFSLFIYKFTPTNVLVHHGVQNYVQSTAICIHSAVTSSSVNLLKNESEKCAFSWFVDSELLNETHGEINIKFVNAQQARLIYKYRNIEGKLQKTIASVWYNEICRAEQLQPKYINIRVNGNSRRSLNTKNTAVKYRIDQELKHLYNIQVD
jgi:hypothetical protein